MTGQTDARDQPDAEDVRKAPDTRTGAEGTDGARNGRDADDALNAAQAAADRDPRVGLRAVAALRRLVERLEALQVASARGQGWSWEEIGTALGVSRQAVHKKHSRR